jgi:hypothetical protein
MASRVLAEFATCDSAIEGIHRKNLSFIFNYWAKRKGDYSFIYYNGKSKLGANAMMLRTLVASPLFHEFEQEANRFVKGVLCSLNKDGSFLPFLIEPEYKYDKNYILTFYSGEAILSLLEFYERTCKLKVFDAALFACRFYINEYVTNIESNYYPAYVPWHCMALNKFFKITRDSRFARAAFVMTDKLLTMQDLQIHKGRFFSRQTPEYGSPHASSDAVYAEGLAYALEIAQMANDQQRSQSYLERLELALTHIASLQYSKERCEHLAHPQRALGGIRIRRTGPTAPFTEKAGSNIRIDCVQHALDAFNKYFEISNPSDVRVIY